MTLDDLWVALCLVLVIEGIMPFLNPEKWQQMLRQVADAPPESLRWFGLAMMVSGATMLVWLSP